MVSGYKTGTQGVFLTAAELTHGGFIISVTSRNAFGADLLVTDSRCQNAWPVQVKTSKDTLANFWLSNAHCETLNNDGEEGFYHQPMGPEAECRDV